MNRGRRFLAKRAAGLLLMRAAPLLLAGLLVTACSRGQQAQPARRGDPALRVAAAVVALEQSGEHQLTPDQARQILPLLKVLRDTPPEDREASQALADQIAAILTAAQRAELDRRREEAQERFRRRAPGAPPGAAPPGGPPGVGPGPAGPGVPGPGFSPDPVRRAEARRRIVDRAIRVLEAKVQ